VRARLIAAEATMKPRSRELQGAARDDRPAQARLRQSVPDAERRLGRSERRGVVAPPEQAPGRGDHRLGAGNDNRMFVQPIVNESPADVLGILSIRAPWPPSPDSGAHVCQEMGSSLQTHLLSYWCATSSKFTLEEAVRMLTFDNASAWELPDRGLVRSGMPPTSSCSTRRR